MDLVHHTPTHPPRFVQLNHRTDVQTVVRDTLHVRRQIQSLELQLRAAMHTDEVLSQYLLQQHGLEI